MAQWDSPMHHIWEYCRGALITQWEFLARKFPEDALVRYNAGLYMMSIPGHEEEAVVYLRAATESPHFPQPVRGEAFRNHGLVLLKTGHVAESEVPLQEALKQPPPDLSAHCLLAAVYKQAGRSKEAARAESGCPSTVALRGSVP